eukprot:scaffold3233_cov128-Skeletonema_marinoi.AAC.2
MIKRGVIPLLMDIAKAGIGRPSIKAMESLGTISRVKDCRTIMLQDDCGLVLVVNPRCRNVFATALLVLHLLWDEEWAEPLSSIEEPGVALTTIRWGLFAMNSIIERAEDRKKERKAMVAKFHELNQKTWCLDDGDEKERARREANEVVSKLRGGSDQLVQCGGLSLLSSASTFRFILRGSCAHAVDVESWKQNGVLLVNVQVVMRNYIAREREQILISFITHASIARSVKFAIGKKTTKRSARKRISEVKLSSVD